MTAGVYAGGIIGWPTPIGGVGLGLFADSSGDVYLEFYYGTPTANVTAGYATDLESLLTGISASGDFGGESLLFSLGGNADSAGGGVSFGTPGAGVTVGFQVFKFAALPGNPVPPPLPGTFFDWWPGPPWVPLPSPNPDPGGPPLGAGAPGQARHDMSDSSGQISPLVLDLSGNGLNLTALSSDSPYFDLTGDGFARKTGWIGSGTGLLALDRGAGPITSGLQLFGTAGGAADGFAALAAYAQLGATTFSAATSLTDPNTGQLYFNEVVVWQDADGNGVADAGEISTLAGLGITSIGLHARGRSDDCWQRGQSHQQLYAGRRHDTRSSRRVVLN